MGYLVEGVNSLSTERPQAHRFSSAGLSSRGVVHNRFNYATQKGMFPAKSQCSGTRLDNSFKNNALCTKDIVLQNTKMYHLARNDN